MGGIQASGSGRARRDAAARAMQGWHSQRLLGNGEVGDPIIKVCGFYYQTLRIIVDFFFLFICFFILFTFVSCSFTFSFQMWYLCQTCMSFVGQEHNFFGKA